MTSATAPHSPGSAVWQLYGLAGTALTPLAGPYLKRRARRGKEDPARLAERFGIASAPEPREPPIWCHAVSVGESVAALTLAARVDAPVVFTTATVTAAQRVMRDKPSNVVHQFAPLDAAVFVRRFLAHWRPQALILTESEIWPATIRAAVKANIPVGLVNGRLSERSFARWWRARALALPLFSSLAKVGAQTESDAARFRALGASTVTLTGNLKFDAPAPTADPDALDALRRAIGNRPIWLAASTHEGEEAAVLSAHRSLSARFARALTIIAPRHPERGVALAAAAGNAPRRSAGAMPSETEGVYIADTTGELGTFFALVSVVWLGGSLVPLGGHNPAEPAAHGAALLTGPCHGEMFAPFICAGAARITASGAIADAVAALWDDEHTRTTMARLAAVVASEQRGALARTMAMLTGLVPIADIP